MEFIILLRDSVKDLVAALQDLTGGIGPGVATQRAVVEFNETFDGAASATPPIEPVLQVVYGAPIRVVLSVGTIEGQEPVDPVQLRDRSVQIAHPPDNRCAIDNQFFDYVGEGNDGTVPEKAANQAKETFHSCM